MSNTSWEEIAPSKLPVNLRDDLQIFRNEKLSSDLLGVSAPTMKCVNFFPNISPKDVLVSLCDVSHRLAWDKNYQFFREMEYPRKMKTNLNELEEDRANANMLLGRPMRTLCHRVNPPWMNAVGLGGRVFCYDRLIVPLLDATMPRRRELTLDRIESNSTGYHVSFIHRDPHECNITTHKNDTFSRIFFQQYTIREAQRGDKCGTELTMTACVDVALPAFFPRALQNYVASKFTTNAFLMLREYLYANVL